MISVVNAPAAKDTITSCGAGIDMVQIDALDVVPADCEVVRDAFADVSFSTPVSVADALQLADAKGADVITLENDYTIGGEPAYDSYVPSPSVDAATAEQQYEQARLGFYQDMVDDHNSADLTAEERTDEQPQIDAMQTALANNDPGNITVTAMTLNGDEQQLQTLAQASPSIAATSDVQTVEVRRSSAVKSNAEADDTTPVEDPDAPADDPNATGGEVTTTDTVYYPRVGRERVAPSAIAGHRYVSQRFKWFNDPPGTIFGGSCCGYEHDFKTENGGGNHYLTGRQTTGSIWRRCFPAGAYWSTSFPRSANPYLDTNLSQ